MDYTLKAAPVGMRAFIDGLLPTTGWALLPDHMLVNDDDVVVALVCSISLYALSPDLYHDIAMEASLNREHRMMLYPEQGFAVIVNELADCASVQEWLPLL